MDKKLYNGYTDSDGIEDIKIDTDKAFEIFDDLELENLIKSDMMNIDTMREDNKDGALEEMAISNNKSISFKEKIFKVFKNSYHKIKDTWNGYIKITAQNFMIPIFFLIGMVIYLEFVLHITNYHSIGLTMIYPVLFAIPFGLLTGFIIGLFKPIINHILLWITTIIVCFVFAIQLVYFYIFKVYFSFQSLGMAGDAISEFSSDIFTAVKANLFGLLLVFLPVFLLGIFFNKRIDFSRRGLKLQIILLGSAGIFHIVALVALVLSGRGDYSPYDLYHKSQVPDLCGKELGITTMTRIDISNLFEGKGGLALADADTVQNNDTKSPTSSPNSKPASSNTKPAAAVTLTPTPVPIETIPNVMDIDFKNLAKNTHNQTYKTLDEYFASAAPTYKNKYTGMFKGYNLILLTAEGFSPFAVNQEKTPTLYKLTHEGFVFNNFYTALWQTSTSDGEYCSLTGLIPTGIRNMYKGRKNLWPLSLGNQFDRLGVPSKAYHNNSYTYYQRNETHPNLGYDFIAKGNGLKLEHPNAWPESDLEMINSTVDDYMNEAPFHVYYMTVSGHMNYNFSGNMMSYKNRAEVQDLPYSEDVKAYIACQIELDKALAKLITKLEEAGVADRTVIALSADHYPYAWDKSIIDEAAGHKVDPDFEIYKNHFILWSEGMKENVEIDKPCSSLDILPTLSNLFGLDYDSRLLMGQDILSDASPLVILSNRSFITDKIKYNAENGKVTKLTDEKLPKDYVSNLNKVVKNKFAVSDSILKNDYYRHVFKNSNK